MTYCGQGAKTQESSPDLIRLLSNFVIDLHTVTLTRCRLRCARPWTLSRARPGKWHSMRGRGLHAAHVRHPAHQPTAPSPVRGLPCRKPVMPGGGQGLWSQRLGVWGNHYAIRSSRRLGHRHCCYGHIVPPPRLSFLLRSPAAVAAVALLETQLSECGVVSCVTEYW